MPEEEQRKALALLRLNRAEEQLSYIPGILEPVQYQNVPAPCFLKKLACSVLPLLKHRGYVLRSLGMSHLREYVSGKLANGQARSLCLLR